MLFIFHSSACMYSLYVPQGIFWLLDKTRHTMSLPTIKNVLSLNYHYVSLAKDLYCSSASFLIWAINTWFLVLLFKFFLSVFNSVEAVIIIFKHATFLRLSSSSAKSALTQAEIDFWASKIDLKIQEHLVASFHENSVEQFADFIMTTDIGLFILSSFKITSHHLFTSIILVLYWKECKEKKTISFKSFKNQSYQVAKWVYQTSQGGTSKYRIEWFRNCVV